MSVFVWTVGDVIGLIFCVLMVLTLLPIYIKDWWRRRK